MGVGKTNKNMKKMGRNMAKVAAQKAGKKVPMDKGKVNKNG